MKVNEYWSALRAALIGMAVGWMVLLVGAWIALNVADPRGLISAVAYIALALGGAIGGFLSGRSGASLPMLGLTAGSYSGTLLLVSMLGGGADRLWIRGAVYLLMALITILVGWLTPSARPKRKYRYK